MREGGWREGREGGRERKRERRGRGGEGADKEGMEGELRKRSTSGETTTQYRQYIPNGSCDKIFHVAIGDGLLHVPLSEEMVETHTASL